MPDQSNHEREIFNAALELTSVTAREAYLHDTCGADVEQRERLETLLRAHDDAGGFLPTEDSRPQAAAAAETFVISASMIPVTEKAGDRIGRYRLLQQIGEGGCGVVYMAEQEEPVRRRVALKVIKLGLDTKQVIARFEAERQALALMDHPNIAKVLDAGATDTGRPYFVMELVRGVRITDYCDQTKLPTTERLALFVQVCQAIQHAHQKGIIHRDIKPSNILVTLHDGEPVPKVIDFGIAKATTNQRLTDKTLFTAFEQFMGTPAYMSPEQAEMSGLDIDTRSDIYALGVLLYELLTGKTPFDASELIESGLDAMRKTIREKEPLRPSARLSTMSADVLTTAAGQRHTEAPKLVHSVRGDLDWVVMKCLEKNRSRRYESANGLAMDIQRHLNSEPVAARPPSLIYVLQKLVRRNKLTFAAAGGVVTALIIGFIGTGIGFVRAEKQRRAAEAAQHAAQENFEQARAAVGDLLTVSDQDLYEAPGMQPLRQKMIQMAIERYKRFLEQSPGNRKLRAELARLYVGLGFAADGNGEDLELVVKPAYNSALAIQKQLVADFPKDRALRSDLGWTLIFSTWCPGSRDQQAVNESISIFEQLMNEDPADPIARTDFVWALVWEQSSRTQRERGLTIREELVKEFPRSAEFRRDLANTLQGFPNQSIENLKRATALQESVVADLEKGDPEIWDPKRPADSEAQIVRPSRQWQQRDLARGYVIMADRYIELNEWTQAIDLFKRGIAIYNKLVRENPSIQTFANERFGQISELTELLLKQGKPGEAEALLRSDIDFHKKLYGESDPRIIPVITLLTKVVRDDSRPFAEEESELRRQIALAQDSYTIPDRATLSRLVRVAANWDTENKPELGLAVGEAALRLLRVGFGTHDRQTVNAMDTVGWVYLDLRRTNEAVAVFEESLRCAKEAFGSDEMFIANRMTSLAQAYIESGRFLEARQLLDPAIATCKAKSTNDVASLVEAYTCLSDVLLRERNFATAEATLREILPVAEAKEQANPNTPLMKHLLGAALGGQKRFVEGEPLLMAGYNQMGQGYQFIGRHRQIMIESVARIVQFYTDWGKADQAIEWRKKLDINDRAKTD